MLFSAPAASIPCARERLPDRASRAGPSCGHGRLTLPLPQGRSQRRLAGCRFRLHDERMSNARRVGERFTLKFVGT